jgi:hypothetical protein
MYFALETIVFDILLIAALGLTPPFLSVWLMRRAKLQAQERLQAVANVAPSLRIRSTQLPPVQDSCYIEGVGYVIGDISCQYNSRSGYMRCAVHPCATSCENCRDYSPKDFGSTDESTLTSY